MADDSWSRRVRRRISEGLNSKTISSFKFSFKITLIFFFSSLIDEETSAEEEVTSAVTGNTEVRILTFFGLLYSFISIF